MMNPIRVVASIEQLEPRRLLASVLPGFADETVVPVISRATSMAFAPDGRLFVTIQDGDVRVVKNDQLLAAPFMTLPVDAVSERGVLGLTFDPDFSTNQFVYVYYTVPDTGTGTVRNRLSRFTALGDVVRAGSERILNTFPALTAGNHNGGAIHFGEDGKLYVAIGDGGNTPTKAQNINSPFGKILRFNTDGSAPVDNPFYSNNGRKDYHDFVWAFGLRNPFTFDIQPGTGKMFINDVGQNTWEEINLGARGANYGWPNSEGPDNTGGFIAPTFFYGHGIGPATGFAITGGVFYNPTTAQFPASYTGDYFYADFVSGWIRTLDAQTNTSSPFADGITSPVDLDIGPDGSLYYLDRGRPGQQIDGRIGRISNLPTAPARVTTDPLDVSVSPGQPATFSVEVTGASPVRFQWQRNNVDIFNANQRSYTLNNVQAGASGHTFRVIVTNDFGTDTSTPATLTVVSNTAPVAKITKPVAGATYRGAQDIVFSGAGTDAEDGVLPRTAFSWRVDFHHDDHTHPFIPQVNNTKSGFFTIPTTGETSANVYYRVYLTVTDSNGVTHTTFRDIQPQKSTTRLVTSVPGLKLNLDGQPRNTPFNFVGVVGISRELAAPQSQVLNGRTWVFDSWSDGGARVHNISTPAMSTTYTAVYRLAAGSVGTGTGLSATYFDNANLTGSTFARTDATVNFFWPASPAPGIGADTFSARWTGQLEPQFTQLYTFQTRSDNGVRVRVNGQLIIDAFSTHPTRLDSGTINLVAGQKVAIVIEFQEQSGNAVIELRWSSAATPLSIIPSRQLYPVS